MPRTGSSPERRSRPTTRPRARVSLAVSEFGQLGARRHDPHTARTEIHHQGGANLDADDPAEAVRIVGNLIPHDELLSGRSGGRGAEGTSGQEAPGRGAGWLHPFQYAAAHHRLRQADHFVEPTVLISTRPLRDTATTAFVISSMIMSGYRSGPRWLMAFADGNAAETLGAFDAGIG